MNCAHTPKMNRQAGFSLIELMLSIIVLVIVMAAVFKQIDSVQKNSKVESLKLDLAQESRGFIDQFARDVHMSGYPKILQFQRQAGGAAPQPTDATVASGIVAASPTSIRFEGSVNGDSTVYSVLYSYFAVDPTGQDPNCPCIRRSITPKVQGGNQVTVQPADPNGQLAPVFYTEVQNIVPPTAGQPIFTYYQANVNPATGDNIVNVGAGVDITTAAGAATLQTIDAIKVTLNTKSRQADPQSRGKQVINAIVGIAELED
jgi:prepilin-type N-terminal cleavage/methylation domain-containing protein